MSMLSRGQPLDRAECAVPLPRRQSMQGALRSKGGTWARRHSCGLESDLHDPPQYRRLRTSACRCSKSDRCPHAAARISNPLSRLRRPRKGAHAILESADPRGRAQAPRRGAAAPLLHRAAVEDGASCLRSRHPAARPRDAGSDRALARRQAVATAGRRHPLRVAAAPGGMLAARQRQHRGRGAAPLRPLVSHARSGRAGSAAARHGQRGDGSAGLEIAAEPQLLSPCPAAPDRRNLLRAPCGLERDRLRRSGLATRLCAIGRQPSRSLGGGRGPGRAPARRESQMTPGDPQHEPRAIDGRAPDVFERDGWVPMRQFADHEDVDFAIVGTGAGGATLAAKLAEAGFHVVAFDAGAFWRPLEDFASDEKEQNKLYWLGDRISGGEHPIEFGANNSGRAVGGSTVHFQMVTLRWRPEWFEARTKLGYGRDWPIAWQEIWRYYDEVEDALKISGPVRYPWGPPRRRYPYREHEVKAAGLVLAKGAEALGIKWCATPLATVSAPRGRSPPCVYRGFCVQGCSTNAKQSALITWIPRAVAAGAEIRDLAMVGRVETDPRTGLATGVHYCREGRWRFQRARHVVVAGYAIETPRLLLNSADSRHPDGLANSSGLVGRNLMVQANQAVYGTMDEAVRWYKGPPSLSLTEHWNYEDRGKDFFGGYCYMAQGPLPAGWAAIVAGSRGLWGEALRREMERYNHAVGLKIVGEVMPDEDNRVTLSDETDEYGLRIARVTFSYGDNDKRLIRHSLRAMRECLEAAGGVRELWEERDDTAHLNGTARMGDDPRRSVVDADCRSWDVRNLWICDGSVFPTVGGVNPSLTIQAIALRTADRIAALAARGEL